MWAQADTDSVNQLKDIVITGFMPNSPRLTSLHIESYSLKKINEKSPFNLSDALAKLPGISQMTTGNSIAKPVIRGLYGNRILVSLSGLRFDNQQWQDEHGMGLSHIGISRVEVIKGPAALLYGSDAVGGVINVIEEVPATEGLRVDAGTQLFSNTRGTLTDAGLMKRKGSRWWNLRAGFESHADYRDGANSRVLNSRSNGLYFKGGFGFERKNWKQVNNYHFSNNHYGFIIDDLLNSFSADAPWSRKMAGPHHIVLLNLLNSQNTFVLRRSTLKLNAGVQSNSRREDEGGGQISLNMHLVSALEKLQWEKSLGEKLTVVVNQQFNFINNTNYGGRIIIPDANMLEAGSGAYVKFVSGRWVVESGLGGSFKSIKTFETRTLNAAGKDVLPFQRNNFTGNAMLGVVYQGGKYWTVKSNMASGYRAPNLAELSSDGIHEGVYRFEIGDPDMRTERNLNTDISLDYHGRSLFTSASVYYNRFYDYIYLAGTPQSFFGFPVYRYHQQGARLYGGEFVLHYKPAFVKGIEFKEQIAVTNGLLDDRNYMPFIPAAKMTSSIIYRKSFTGKIADVMIEPEWQSVFRQSHAAQFETPTADYQLFNLYAGMELRSPSGNWRLGITCKNLTNKKYADHLSRLKYYGLYNEGINFVLSARRELLLGRR
jgi:iron complex outermembrane receptor protein